MGVSEGNMQEALREVLEKVFNQEITAVSCETKELKGGTVGEITFLSGMATTEKGEKLPYKVVCKKQKKWERYGDPDSWRREYDLYKGNLDTVFSDSFRWPKCYAAEISDEGTQIWMEYIDGVSGSDLTGEMYEQSALELGRFQSRLYADKPEALSRISNLSSKDFCKNFYYHYRSWNEVYDYIRAQDCEIPKHLCEMLIDLDERAEAIWNEIEQLPVVLCHRDFWVANIFYSDQKIRLIDWDTAGFGYAGEDIASLLADEADVAHMAENYKRCVKAYYRGFAEYSDVSQIKYSYIKEFILFLFGYRLVEGIKFAETQEEKRLQLYTLQKIYEIEDEFEDRK